MNDFVIKNARVVTPGRIIEKGGVAVKNGIISRVFGENEKADDATCVVDASNKWLFPGFVDLHNDAIEKEIEPRPNALFPPEIALFSLESRLLCHGITTIFHSLSFVEAESEVRNLNNIMMHIDGINRVKKYGSIRHFIHARYEVPDIAFFPVITELIEKRMVQLLSFMDHTPGQGQYKNVDNYRFYLRNDREKTGEEIRQIIESKIKKAKNSEIFNYMTRLRDIAEKHGIPIASHDDDSSEKVRFMKEFGVKISEFPVDIETAMAAKSMSQHVILGAPNVVRGMSNTGNLRAADAIENNAADSLCSDYHPSSMLHAVFILHNRHGLAIDRAVNMVSLNPAKAVGIDDSVGSVECGKTADMILVDEIDGMPVVEQVFVGGIRVLKKREMRINHGFHEWNNISKKENAFAF